MAIPYNLRQVQPPQAPLPDKQVVDIATPDAGMPKSGTIAIDLPDGSVAINFGGLPNQPKIGRAHV